MILNPITCVKCGKEREGELKIVQKDGMLIKLCPFCDNQEENIEGEQEELLQRLIESFNNK